MNEHQNFPNLNGINDAFGVPVIEEGPTPPAYVTAATRQEERQSAIPALYKTTHERLAAELALRMEEPETIFARYGYTPEAASTLMESVAFTVLLDRIGAEVRENGLSFRMKAKAISEELLPHAFDMASDPLCSSAVRADIIKWFAKVAGNEPPPAKGEVAGGGGFTLAITFAGQQPQQIIAGREPLTIDQQ